MGTVDYVKRLDKNNTKSVTQIVTSIQDEILEKIKPEMYLKLKQVDKKYENNITKIPSNSQKHKKSIVGLVEFFILITVIVGFGRAANAGQVPSSYSFREADPEALLIIFSITSVLLLVGLIIEQIYKKTIIANYNPENPNPRFVFLCSIFFLSIATLIALLIRYNERVFTEENLILATIAVTITSVTALIMCLLSFRFIKKLNKTKTTSTPDKTTIVKEHQLEARDEAWELFIKYFNEQEQDELFYKPYLNSLDYLAENKILPPKEIKPILKRATEWADARYGLL